MGAFRCSSNGGVLVDLLQYMEPPRPRHRRQHTVRQVDGIFVYYTCPRSVAKYLSPCPVLAADEGLGRLEFPRAAEAPPIVGRSHHTWSLCRCSKKSSFFRLPVPSHFARLPLAYVESFDTFTPTQEFTTGAIICGDGVLMRCRECLVSGNSFARRMKGTTMVITWSLGITPLGMAVQCRLATRRHA